MADEYLKTYLNDHLAGALGGVELAKRCRSNNEGTSLAEALDRLIAEIDEDRQTLERIMEELDVPQNPVKQAATWLGEKVGRLKPNEKIKGYSDLSRLVELETLGLGVEGKASLWRSLLQVQGDYPELDKFDLPALLTRAESQRDRVEEYRREAAAKALAGAVERTGG